MTKNNAILNSREDFVSMVLGLGVVVLVVIMIFNFVSKRKGNISVPGVMTNTTQTPLTTPGKIETVVENNNYYQVKKGESLWQIAQNNYGDGNLWKQIAIANNIKDGSYIEVDQKLILPKVTPILAKTESKIDGKGEMGPDTYQVKFGDSLWKIAIANFGDGYKWTQIWNLNKKIISNPNRLEIGMMIKLR